MVVELSICLIVLFIIPVVIADKNGFSWILEKSAAFNRYRHRLAWGPYFTRKMGTPKVTWGWGCPETGIAPATPVTYLSESSLCL
jgi:hypothetical protein